MIAIDPSGPADQPIPNSFDDLVDEIVACSDADRDAVREKLWRQAIGPGNVEREAVAFGLTPHVFDAAMERFYRESDAFIFETLLYGQRPSRRAWNAAALERIERHARKVNVPCSALRILLFGDGCGEDSLYLAGRGCRVDYFDVAGSRTFEFATRRFAYHGVLDRRVHVRTDLSSLQTRGYDVVLSFEVLEHLPQPQVAIQTMARLLKPGGIALISEAFECVNPAFPTHLACNYALRDTTAFLCFQAGLVLRWSNPQQPCKPMEFERRELSRAGKIAVLARSRWILRAALLLLVRGRWRDARLA